MIVLNKKFYLIGLVVIMLCVTIITPVFANTGLEQTLKITIPAPSLQNNLLSDPAVQTCYIYLPPSYHTTKTHFPVVYFLHGYGGSPASIVNFEPVLNQMIAEKTLPEVIVVGVNGKNALGGSFFVNSPVTGNWEDFLINDVVSYIDHNYRTIAKPHSRGIAGFSMGGFAALNLAFKHPELFSVVYSLSPGLFNPDGLKKALPLWDNRFLSAYGAAFSPNLNQPYPFANILSSNDVSKNASLWDKWENGFGNLQTKLNDYLNKKHRLNAIRIEYGNKDFFVWIPEGCIYLSELLNSAKIDYELLTHNGGHSLDLNILRQDMFPFFAKHLQIN
ncbi:MAG TPA: alpha/beta hydrolase-fold protein [Bacillota bacterium]|nr:alpha/beta hydrolase-fold protein [Bacillota bacterium]